MDFHEIPYHIVVVLLCLGYRFVFSLFTSFEYLWRQPFYAIIEFHEFLSLPEGNFNNFLFGIFPPPRLSHGLSLSKGMVPIEIPDPLFPLHYYHYYHSSSTNFIIKMIFLLFRARFILFSSSFSFVYEHFRTRTDHLTNKKNNIKFCRCNCNCFVGWTTMAVN